MTTEKAIGWYVYAVMPNSADLPMCIETVVPGSVLQKISGISTSGRPALAAVVSAVPQELFLEDNPDNCAGDPDWVAARAASHHIVVAQCNAGGPCVPLGFGTLFSSRQTVQDWLSKHDRGLRSALLDIAGRQEWAVALTERSDAHAIWLRERDERLRALADEVATASSGTAFLLARRLAKALNSARAAHLADMADQIGKRLNDMCATLNEAPRSGAAASWCLLTAPGDGVNALLDNIGSVLAEMGLSLRVTGPWPPYAFARAAWQRHANG